MSTVRREHSVELPIGYADDAGTRHREAVVRKMRGHEEAFLYDASLGPADLVTHLLAGTLLRLGQYETPGVGVVERMYCADRNYLLLEVRRVTLGDAMPATYTCPACASDVRTIERLDEMPVRRLADGQDPEAIALELEDGYVDRSGVEHRAVTLRLPRGEDEAFVTNLVGADPMRATDALTLRCLRSFGTVPMAELEAYGLRILRDLSLGDRALLRQAIDGGAPGASFRTSVRCPACGASFEHRTDVSSFFVPAWAGDTASEKRSSTSPTISTGPGVS